MENKADTHRRDCYWKARDTSAFGDKEQPERNVMAKKPKMRWGEL